MAFVLMLWILSNGCTRTTLVQIPFPTTEAPATRVELALRVPDTPIIAVRGALASVGTDEDTPAERRVQIWAQREDGTALLLFDRVLEAGDSRFADTVDLKAIEGDRVLLAAVAIGGQVVWDKLQVVGTTSGDVRRPGAEAGDPAKLADAPNRPDIVLYVVDALRADALSAYGGPIPTPGFDTIAARGVEFTHAWSTSSWTRPAVASVLTGLYPASHGVHDRDNALPEAVFTLAEALRLRGYRTIGVVSNGNIDAHWGMSQGFETYVMAPNPRPTVPGVPAFPRAGQIHHLALDLWRDRSDNRPKFMYVHIVDPHGPYAPPEWLLQRPRPIVDEPNTEKTLVALNTRKTQPTARLLQKLRDLYLGEVAYADREFGRFLAALGDDANPDQALFILTADHGEARMEHGLASHGLSLHQEEVHIPLLVSGPGFARGGVVRDQVSLIDIAPTVLLAAGDRAMDHPGVDLARLVRGHGVERTLIAELNLDGRRWRASWRGPTKLLWDQSRNRLFLYDLQTDPDEHSSLAERRPRLTGKMKLELERLIARLEATRPAEASTVEADPSSEVLENLRALGYIR